MSPARQFPLVAASVLLLLLMVEISASPGQTRPMSENLLSELAGSYYRGDGLGVNQTLRIAPDGSYGFQWEGCLGTYSRSAGRAVPRCGDLFLEVTFEDPRNRAPAAEGLYKPVRWGERRYLIPADRMMSFVNEVNLGSEPRDDAHGGHFLRQDDWKTPVSGLPELPEPYGKYLLKEPAEGTVLHREDGAFEVAFSSGSGIAPGMALVARGEEAASFCEMEVVSVSGTIAVARPEDYGACDFLRPGSSVSTCLSGLPSAVYRSPGSRWAR